MDSFFLRGRFRSLLVGVLVFCSSVPGFALTVREGQFFWVLGTITVQYGVPGKYIDVVYTLGNGTYQSCSATSDPAPGIVKQCIVPEQTCSAEQLASMPAGVCKEVNPADEACAPKAGKESISEGVQWVVGGTNLTTRFCDSGCEARGSMAASGGDGAIWITGPALFTGKSCQTAQAETPSEPVPSKSDNVPGTRCALGQCPGYINGLWTCHKCSSTLSTSTSSSSSTTTNRDTGGASTSTTTTNTTTTSSTTCSGSTCTTTTTNETKNPDGTTSTTSSSSSQPKDTFCTQNPKAAACLVGAWGGSCSAGFSCDGDAVQCAIARENHKRNCELFENETADSQQGKAIANGQARPEGHPGNSPESINVSGNINQTNPYGGSCPPDINLSVYGKTVVIPLSNACDIFKWMGYIAVAFTMYAAARITMGGVSA